MSEAPKDISSAELIRLMEDHLEQHPNDQLYVKWTCPKCGQRCTSPDANTFHTQGYLHDELSCGHLYTGDQFGLLLVASMGGTQ